MLRTLGNGLVAQLEERRNGIAEVVSSNLIGSTNFPDTAQSTTDLPSKPLVRFFESEVQRIRVPLRNGDFRRA